MKSRITRNDFRVILEVYVTLLLAAAVAWKKFGNAAILPFVVTALVIMLIVQFESLRRASEEMTQMRQSAFDDYRQIESLLSLMATLKPELPLPPMRDHSASPDLLRHAVSLILSHKPAVVLELGSGASTIVLAYCQKRLGGGRIVSIDHDAEYAAQTAAMIENHGLQAFASVTHVPLAPLRVDGREYLWYSTKYLPALETIDFLMIDGPPYHVHPLARYPAIPLLHDRLASDAVILLDDADRPEERRIAKMWKAEFADLSFARLEAEKGALLLTRSVAGSSDGFARELGENKRTAHPGSRVELS